MPENPPSVRRLAERIRNRRKCHSRRLVCHGGRVGGLFVNCSLDGRELSVCGWNGSETGLWIHDRETEATAKITDLYATTVRWSGGKHPRLAVAFGMPLTGIWMWELKVKVRQPNPSIPFRRSRSISVGLLSFAPTYSPWSLNSWMHTTLTPTAPVNQPCLNAGILGRIRCCYETGTLFCR